MSLGKSALRVSAEHTGRRRTSSSPPGGTLSLSGWALAGSLGNKVTAWQGLLGGGGGPKSSPSPKHLGRKSQWPWKGVKHYLLSPKALSLHHPLQPEICFPFITTTPKLTTKSNCSRLKISMLTMLESLGSGLTLKDSNNDSRQVAHGAGQGKASKEQPPGMGR